MVSHKKRVSHIKAQFQTGVKFAKRDSLSCSITLNIKSLTSASTLYSEKMTIMSILWFLWCLLRLMLLVAFELKEDKRVKQNEHSKRFFFL